MVPVGQRRLSALVVGLAMSFLLSFLALSPLMPSVVAQPDWLETPTLWVTVAAVALLAGDVILPVPSSIVMVANGAVFGALAGTLISTLGSTLAAAIGHALGRSTTGRTRAWLGTATAGQLGEFLDRHGTVAVIATRPIPIAAEVVAVLAGQGGMPRGRFVGAAVLGNFATSAVYAVAGAMAVANAAWAPLAVAALLATGARLVSSFRRTNRSRFAVTNRAVTNRAVTNRTGTNRTDTLRPGIATTNPDTTSLGTTSSGMSSHVRPAATAPTSPPATARTSSPARSEVSTSTTTPRSELP